MECERKGYMLLQGQSLGEAVVHCSQSLSLLPAGFVKDKVLGDDRAVCWKEQALSVRRTVVHNLNH